MMMMMMSKLTVTPTIPMSNPTTIRNRINRINRNRVLFGHRVCCCSGLLEEVLKGFEPEVPIQEAWTPPSTWYTNPSFYNFELNRVFYTGWQAVGYTGQIRNPHDFFTGSLGNVGFVVCRDDNGMIRAFHNVCRHHGSLIASGTGNKSCLVCPYHGWTYGLDGALLKATRITGIRNFDVQEFGLLPINVATWGPFVLLNLDEKLLPHHQVDESLVENEWLGSSSELLIANGVDSSLSYVCRRVYNIECNWKVFCDNYLDGGYHVPYAHKGLASGLKLDSYSTTILENVSIQQCEGGTFEDQDIRVGSKALYGPWMDTNLVLPLGPRKCQVVFDYFIETPLKEDQNFIERSLVDSERVQIEDIVLCEGVQKGLESPAYCSGRYAPTVEKAMYHFHRLLYADLSKSM